MSIGAVGGPFTVGLSDPEHGLVGRRALEDRALATSSPGAMRLAGESHILDPRGRAGPRWSSVSVEAEGTAVADAASTAFCLMDRAGIAPALARLPGGHERRWWPRTARSRPSARARFVLTEAPAPSHDIVARRT